MKTEKKHQFVVTVTGAHNTESARLKLLVAFAKRSPDGASFSLVELRKFQRQQWRKNTKALREAGTRISKMTAKERRELDRKTREFVERLIVVKDAYPIVEKNEVVHDKDFYRESKESLAGHGITYK